MSVLVGESSGITAITEIRSQAMAARICKRFQADGISARLRTLPGIAGYQVTVPGLDLIEIERALRELQIDPRRQ